MKNARRLLALPAIATIAIAGSACLGYAPEGSVATPAAPGQNAASRLPELLSQLQGAGAGLELLDSPSNQVLAAQDQQGKFADETTPTVTATVTGTRTVTPTSVAQTNPTNTPRPS